MIKIIESMLFPIIRSELLALASLLFALSAQVPHAAHVFSSLSDDGLWHGWLYAIALESAVLLYAVRNMNWISYGAACVSIAMNLSYYTISGIDLFSVAALPGWLVSVSLPVCIAVYSHTIALNAAEQTQPTKSTTKPTVTEKPRKTPQIKPERKRDKSPSVQERITAMMQRGEEINVVELAEKWGKSQSTVRSALSRARKQQKPEPILNGTGT